MDIKRDHMPLFTVVFLFGIIVGMLALFNNECSAQYIEDDIDKEYVEIPGVRKFSGQLIVRPIQLDTWKAKGFKRQAAAEKVKAARQKINSQRIKKYYEETDEYIIEVMDGKSENEHIKDLKSTGLYQYVEPDWIVSPADIPNDPLYSNQWHHAWNRMQSGAGWSFHAGTSDVSIGICDTGIRTTHQDLLLNRLVV